MQQKNQKIPELRKLIIQFQLRFIGLNPYSLSICLIYCQYIIEIPLRVQKAYEIMICILFIFYIYKIFTFILTFKQKAATLYKIK